MRVGEESTAQSLAPDSISATDTGLPPQCLELELTESLLLEDSTDILATLRSLSDLGVRLSLDDFGTGLSSFGRSPSGLMFTH